MEKFRPSIDGIMVCVWSSLDHGDTSPKYIRDTVSDRIQFKCPLEMEMSQC